MAKKITNMAQLSAEINRRVEKALSASDSMTAEVIKVTQSDMIDREVYDPYEPKEYERRARGGLGDVDNMRHEATSDGRNVKMIVVNVTPPHPYFNSNNLVGNQLALLVEGGHGKHGLKYGNPYDQDGNLQSYARPRPFMRATVDELRRSKIHFPTVKVDLKRHGLNVK